MMHNLRIYPAKVILTLDVIKQQIVNGDCQFDRKLVCNSITKNYGPKTICFLPGNIIQESGDCLKFPE